MSGELVVTIFGEPCGEIVPHAGIDYGFRYLPEWRPEARRGISLALPRSEAEASSDRARAYFGGVLPEGAARRHLAQAHGIDELDDVALLRLIGHECPGAIRVHDTGSVGEATASGIKWLDDGARAAFVEALRVPGAAGIPERYSVSLAGAQLKRGIVVEQGGEGATSRVGLPLGTALSTHIVKLAVSDYDGIVQNEHAMQQLAGVVGIPASRTSVQRFGEEHALVVERYDRSVRADGSIEWQHQEDFCQALGRLSSHKYERFDAVSGTAIGPTMLDMIDLLRSKLAPSVQQVDDLLRLIWFNIIIGNVDAHAKNYSLLYQQDLEQVGIAPLYDAICITAHHAEVTFEERRRDEPLVMNVGGQTRFWQLTSGDVRAHAAALGIRPGYLKQRLSKLVQRVDHDVDGVVSECQAGAATRHEVLDVVQDEIHRRCAFLAELLEAV